MAQASTWSCTPISGCEKLKYNFHRFLSKWFTLTHKSLGIQNHKYFEEKRKINKRNMLTIFTYNKTSKTHSVYQECGQPRGPMY